MNMADIQYILTDIEGTTTSVSFVYDQLFPYFRNNMHRIESMISLPEVQEALNQTVEIAANEQKSLPTIASQIEQLRAWSLADQKITPLKTLQGILWEEAYVSGEIKGHVYPDVAPALHRWNAQGIELGVFSSGSVAAQKLIFGYSESGDLRPYFSAYFDTKTGGKKETATYTKIAKIVEKAPENILFLSDITEELHAAREAGMNTIQLVRPGTIGAWDKTVSSFDEI